MTFLVNIVYRHVDKDRGKRRHGAPATQPGQPWCAGGGRRGRMRRAAYLAAGGLVCAVLAVWGLTYAGLPYRIVWPLATLLLILPPVARLLAARMRAGGARRSTDVGLRGYRRARLVQELLAQQQRSLALRGESGRALATGLAHLVEEVRMFPVHAARSDADRIEDELRQWVRMLAQRSLADANDDECRQWNAQARFLRRRLAEWQEM